MATLITPTRQGLPQVSVITTAILTPNALLIWFRIVSADLSESTGKKAAISLPDTLDKSIPALMQ